MSVIAFATGIGDIAQKESTTVGTTTESYLGTYVEEGLHYDGTTSAPVTTSNSTMSFEEQSGDFWVSATIRPPSSSYWGDSNYFLAVTDSSGESETGLCFGLKAEGYGRTMDLVWYDGSSTETLVSDIGTVSGTSLPQVAVRFDINFRYGTGGGIDLYVDRELVYEGDFDTTTMGRSASKLRLGPPSYNTNADTYFSSIIVADEDTTLLTMVQFEIESNGTFTDFTNGYSYLQTFGETGDNYSVESSEAGDVSTYKFASRSSEIDGGTVVGLGISCRAKTQEAVSADQFRFVAYDGTDTAYSDYIEMDQYITPYQAILTTNPAGDAWTLSDIATHEFGFEVSENG